MYTVLEQYVLDYTSSKSKWTTRDEQVEIIKAMPEYLVERVFRAIATLPLEEGVLQTITGMIFTSKDKSIVWDIQLGALVLAVCQHCGLYDINRIPNDKGSMSYLVKPNADLIAEGLLETNLPLDYDLRPSIIPLEYSDPSEHILGHKTNTLMKISMNNGNKVKYEINRLRPNTSPILDGMIDTYEKRVEKPFYLISKSIEDTFSFMENNMDKVDIFVAVGGDGTISTVAQKLINTDKILGIFPAGSGNGFANENHFSKNIDTLLSKIKNRKHREIDTFTINDKLSINLSGAGFDGEVAKNFEKTSRGFANYIKTSISTFFKFKPINISFEEKYKSYNGEYLMMNLANTRQFGNNAYIAPQALVTDGLVDVVLVKKFPVWYAAPFALKMFVKTLKQDKYLTYFTCSELEFSLDTDTWHIDGEYKQISSPVKVKVLPKSLKILI